MPIEAIVESTFAARQTHCDFSHSTVLRNTFACGTENGQDWTGYIIYIYIYIYIHLWCNYSNAKMKKLQVAYNDALRIFLCCSFNAVLRNVMYRFMCRLTGSLNTIIVSLTDPILLLETLDPKLVCVLNVFVL